MGDATNLFIFFSRRFLPARTFCLPEHVLRSGSMELRCAQRDRLQQAVAFFFSRLFLQITLKSLGRPTSIPRVLLGHKDTTVGWMLSLLSGVGCMDHLRKHDSLKYDFSSLTVDLFQSLGHGGVFSPPLSASGVLATQARRSSRPSLLSAVGLAPECLEAVPALAPIRAGSGRSSAPLGRRTLRGHRATTSVPARRGKGTPLPAVLWCARLVPVGRGRM